MSSNGEHTTLNPEMQAQMRLLDVAKALCEATGITVSHDLVTATAYALCLGMQVGSMIPEDAERFLDTVFPDRILTVAGMVIDRLMKR